MPTGGGFYFYSLSINSLTPGGSGASPFLFLISATAAESNDFGTSVHSLKEVFQVARPAVWPLISSDNVNVSEAGISPVTILDAPFLYHVKYLATFARKDSCHVSNQISWDTDLNGQCWLQYSSTCSKQCAHACPT